MKKLWTAVVLGSTIAFLTTALDASAATIRVKCEKRSNRSKISVDGSNLPQGTYRAQVLSGTNKATAIPEAALGDEVEFDFDSNPADIAAGANPISANFIQGGQVIGKILNARGATVITDTVQCRVRR